MTRRELEFRIPELVRTAEGVIALPRGSGRELFRERAQQLASELQTDAFVGAELGDLLLELYDLRSACVHGKVPFLNLQKLGDAGVLRAGKLSFVAENLARVALLVALRAPRPDVFVSREGLEGADVPVMCGEPERGPRETLGEDRGRRHRPAREHPSRERGR